MTGFVQLKDAAARIQDRRELDRYFEGFCIGTLLLGALGTILGDLVASVVPEQALRLLIFITPLYLLLLTGRTRDTMMLIAAMLGCVVVPLAHLWHPGRGVVAGGLAAGTLGFLAHEWKGRP